MNNQIPAAYSLWVKWEAARFEILLKLQIVTAGKYITLFLCCVVYANVIKGSARKSIHETATRPIARTSAVKHITNQKNLQKLCVFWKSSVESFYLL